MEKELENSKSYKTFFIPKQARWGQFKDLTLNIGPALDKAFKAIEDEPRNAELVSVLTTVNYNDKERVPDGKLNQLIQIFDAMNLSKIMAASTTGFAATTSMNITAVYDNIKIYIGEKLIEPKDADGNVVEPLIHNGTTYLPVRAVAEAFGKPVTWDGATKSVYVGAQQAQTNTKQPIVLSSVNYIAGTDFPAGTYDILSLSSGGNVISGNSYNGGINVIIGTVDMNNDLGIELYELSYKNILLPQGTELSLKGAMGNFQIQLVPNI